MSNIFNSIRINKPKRNLFNLSHEVKTTGNIGDLIPFMCEPVYPGDKFKVTSEMLVKTMPLLAPIMHRVDVFQHFFFVPMRLIVPDWEEIITGGKNGDKLPTVPHVNVHTDYDTYNKYCGESTLADYLGFPTPPVNCPAFPDAKEKFGSARLFTSFPVAPFNAYQKIFWDYYRDENFIEDDDEFMYMQPTWVSCKTAEDIEKLKIFQLRKRAFRKDYFTSALPEPQRGVDVQLPINGEVEFGFKSNNTATLLRHQSGEPFLTTDTNVVANGGNFKAGNTQPLNVDNSAQLTGRVESSTLTINDLRKASRLQQWFERNARGGYRYIEQIFAHFGVRSSDARLQRAEFLGGCKVPFIVSEVLQQSQGTEDSPLGQQSGHGVAVNNQKGFTRSFEEHGFVFGILSIMPKTGYFQGYPKKFEMKDRFDFYWPEFAHLGEQEVKNKEVYHNFLNIPVDEDTFGYQSRYAQFKHRSDVVNGKFKSSLLYWHLARAFYPKDSFLNYTPNLNKDFIYPQDKEFNRIFPVEDGDNHFYIQIYNNVRALRPMPKYGTPQL